ncbi:MAG: Wzy polymerase domain-containing protein [Pseudorhodoferax sp.]
MVLLTMAFALSWGQRNKPVRLTYIAATALVVAAVPWMQYAAGQLQFVGIAWVGSAYVLGFALAVLVGQRWEEHAPGQLGDGLFAALLIAALLSVGLQLHQWLGLDLMDVWLMGNGSDRPYANVGQPNQLATLLLWGILALWWFCWRGRVRPLFAAFATVFLSWGLTLTASRAAWIAVLLLLVCVWCWSPLWSWVRARGAASLLALCFVLQSLIAPVVTELLLLSPFADPAGIAARGSGELRLQAWRLFLDAVVRAPWWGYGWNQGSMAQLTVAPDHAPLQILFQYSHNLFLDLILWCGIPIGGALTVALVAWLWRRMRAVRDGGSALLFMVLLVVGNHAMLEFPLHHAYMLLPAGLVIGVLDSRLRAKVLPVQGLRLQWLLAIVCALMLAAIVRDYLRIEAAYQALRFEQANFRLPAPSAAPDVLLLDQMQAPIALAKLEPSPANAPSHLDWMRRTALIYPNGGTVHKLAASLAWAGQPDEAATWLRRMCAVVLPQECSAVRAAWKAQAMADPAIARVQWPE